jgi:hypothetical protein
MAARGHTGKYNPTADDVILCWFLYVRTRTGTARQNRSNAGGQGVVGSNPAVPTSKNCSSGPVLLTGRLALILLSG